MTDIMSTEKATQKARDLLTSRVSVVERLVTAARAHNDAQTLAAEAEKTLTAAYADAERAGWSPAELAQFGVRKPERRAPGRPRQQRQPATTAQASPPPAGLQRQRHQVTERAPDLALPTRVTHGRTRNALDFTADNSGSARTSDLVGVGPGPREATKNSDARRVTNSSHDEGGGSGLARCLAPGPSADQRHQISRP